MIGNTFRFLRTVGTLESRVSSVLNFLTRELETHDLELSPDHFSTLEGWIKEDSPIKERTGEYVERGINEEIKDYSNVGIKTPEHMRTSK